jgi:hypothetical protein
MDDGVLARKRKPVGTRGKPEDFAVCMKSGNSRIYGNEGILVNNGATDEVAELDDIRNSFDYWTGNVSSNCGQIHLDYINKIIVSGEGFN